MAPEYRARLARLVDHRKFDDAGSNQLLRLDPNSFSFYLYRHCRRRTSQKAHSRYHPVCGWNSGRSPRRRDLDSQCNRPCDRHSKPSTWHNKRFRYAGAAGVHRRDGEQGRCDERCGAKLGGIQRGALAWAGACGLYHFRSLDGYVLFPEWHFIHCSYRRTSDDAIRWRSISQEIARCIPYQRNEGGRFVSIRKTAISRTDATRDSDDAFRMELYSEFAGRCRQASSRQCLGVQCIISCERCGRAPCRAYTGHLCRSPRWA